MKRWKTSSKITLSSSEVSALESLVSSSWEWSFLALYSSWLPDEMFHISLSLSTGNNLKNNNHYTSLIPLNLKLIQVRRLLILKVLFIPLHLEADKSNQKEYQKYNDVCSFPSSHYLSLLFGKCCGNVLPHHHIFKSTTSSITSHCA